MTEPITRTALPLTGSGGVDRDRAGTPRLVRRLIAAGIGPGARMSLVSIFDQGVVSGTSFLTTVIIGRAAGQDQLGVYALALSIVLLARGIQEQVIAAPYAVYCHRREGRALASYVGSTVVHQLILSAVTVIGLLALAVGLWLGPGSSTLASTVWVLVPAVPCLLFREYIRHVSFAHMQVWMATAIDVTVSVVQLGGFLLLASLGMLTVPVAYVVMAVACAGAAAGWLLVGRRPMRFAAARCIADWWHNWAFSRWTLASHLIGSTTPIIMPWVLVVAHGEAATGVLAACYGLAGLAHMFIIGVGNVLTPRAASVYASEGVPALQRVLRKTAALFGVCLGGVCLLLLVAGERLMVVIYGPPYAGSGPVVAVLAVSVLVRSMSVTTGNGLWAIHHPRANFRADAVTLVATLAAAVALVPPLAVMGAAIAILAGAAAGAIVRYWVLVRLLRTLRETPS